jgi:hypothetical protein
MVHGEVTLYSELLDIATQADTVIEHPDGDLSLVDWKLGNVFRNFDTDQLIK